jgi:hypothetical protein
MRRPRSCTTPTPSRALAGRSVPHIEFDTAARHTPATLELGDPAPAAPVVAILARCTVPTISDGPTGRIAPWTSCGGPWRIWDRAEWPRTREWGRRAAGGAYGGISRVMRTLWALRFFGQFLGPVYDAPTCGSKHTEQSKDTADASAAWSLVIAYPTSWHRFAPRPDTWWRMSTVPAVRSMAYRGS